MEKETLIRLRLGLKTDLTVPNEQKDMNPAIASLLKKELKRVEKTMKKQGIGEDEYRMLAAEYLDRKYAEVKYQNWQTCHYIFIGIGSYDVTFPEDQLQCLMNYINGNGSAFADNPRTATEEEIRTALALHAGDGLELGDV